jgi:hypothetical protein
VYLLVGVVLGRFEGPYPVPHAVPGAGTSRVIGDQVLFALT